MCRNLCVLLTSLSFVVVVVVASKSGKHSTVRQSSSGLYVDHGSGDDLEDEDDNEDDFDDSGERKEFPVPFIQKMTSQPVSPFAGTATRAIRREGLDAAVSTGPSGNPNNVDPVQGRKSSPSSSRVSAKARPTLIAGIIGGVAVVLVCTILLLLLIVYRLRKKDEGSYALDEPKNSPSVAYTRAGDRELFA